MGNATSWLTQTFCPEEQVVWVAAKSGDLATIQQALGRVTPATRAYLEWKDPICGYTPLATACVEGHVHCVYALLNAGVDVNARDNKSYTPLHLATMHGKSEIVRMLLDNPGVDAFARTDTKRQTALDIARHEYTTTYDKGHQLVQCIEVIEKKLCVYSGWLYQRTDNLLSLASGLSSLHSWKKRYCMVLRAADTTVVEIDLFAMKPGEKRPPCPTLEIVYRVSEGLQENADPTWFNRKEHRFSLSGYTKSGINRVSAPQTFDFAASNHGDLVSWKNFFGSMRLGAAPASMPSMTATTAMPQTQLPPISSTMLNEQRELERALQLSREEARRHSARMSLPNITTAFDSTSASAPPWNSQPASPQATLAPDGVEIVQPLQLASPEARDVRRQSAPVSYPTDQDNESKGGGECVICFDGPQSAVCVPCGHNAICMDCAQELLRSTKLCPVCRVQVREVVKIYRV
ncbi:hypothetical protein Poli38472_002498 [Pythium oligandrum]|uniref:RING-type domain-containing protein n=1 Tax=Pythium oligandrum TaxID=41045 RepID=A0A8K1FL76_PYTOL|nr:hypothetical protein Poli38472_002498 [Pythium oligandrum]|eukprot:TMW63557.1 hypothetical protein Poli38472_002498 [Pythium oligandrum]